MGLADLERLLTRVGSSARRRRARAAAAAAALRGLADALLLELILLRLLLLPPAFAPAYSASPWIGFKTLPFSNSLGFWLGWLNIDRPEETSEGVLLLIQTVQSS